MHTFDAHIQSHLFETTQMKWDLPVAERIVVTSNSLQRDTPTHTHTHTHTHSHTLNHVADGGEDPRTVAEPAPHVWAVAEGLLHEQEPRGGRARAVFPRLE